MRVSMTLAVAALAITAVAAQNPSPKDFVGKWEITGTGPDSKKIYFLDVVDKGDHLEAKFLDRSAHATPVPWIKVENGELVWQKGNSSDTLPQPSCGPVYHAKLQGGKLTGHHEEPGSAGFSSADAGAPCPARGAGAGGAGRAAAGGQGRAAGDQLTTPEQQAANMAAMRAAAPPAPPKEARPPHTVNWTAVKQPIFKPSNANGNHTYGKPMTIVGPGVGKETWSGLTPDTWQNECVDRWTVDANGLKNAVPGPGEKPTCNIYTKDKWQDFKADADIVLDIGQNSGFYLRGRHELQLMLPNPNGRGGAAAESSYPGQLMDIYGWKRADPPAVPNPAGEEQHLSVIVVGNHVTAIFNGKKVHDNALLYAWTGGALDNKEDQPGPIMIQGDHSRVTIKKLVVTPITKAGL
jgi:hypothetical protein